MNNIELQKIVEEISLQYFKKPFLHQATFNSRLRTTGGRYLLSSGNIEINKKYYDVHGYEELVGIIKHELVHYHLHQSNKGYQHRDRDFKVLAAEVGAPRYCTPLEKNMKKARREIKHKYQCENCSQLFLRRRRVDIKRFVCGKCGGRLKQI